MASLPCVFGDLVNGTDCVCWEGYSSDVIFTKYPDCALPTVMPPVVFATTFTPNLLIVGFCLYQLWLRRDSSNETLKRSLRLWAMGNTLFVAYHFTVFSEGLHGRASLVLLCVALIAFFNISFTYPLISLLNNLIGALGNKEKLANFKRRAIIINTLIALELVVTTAVCLFPDPHDRGSWAFFSNALQGVPIFCVLYLTFLIWAMRKSVAIFARIDHLRIEIEGKEGNSFKQHLSVASGASGIAPVTFSPEIQHFIRRLRVATALMSWYLSILSVVITGIPPVVWFATQHLPMNWVIYYLCFLNAPVAAAFQIYAFVNTARTRPKASTLTDPTSSRAGRGVNNINNNVDGIVHGEDNNKALAVISLGHSEAASP